MKWNRLLCQSRRATEIDDVKSAISGDSPHDSSSYPATGVLLAQVFYQGGAMSRWGDTGLRRGSHAYVTKRFGRAQSGKSWRGPAPVPAAYPSSTGHLRFAPTCAGALTAPDPTHRAGRVANSTLALGSVMGPQTRSTWSGNIPHCRRPVGFCDWQQTDALQFGDLGSRQAQAIGVQGRSPWERGQRGPRSVPAR